MSQDPRYAPDLRAAAQNADGSYSLPRAMAWLSEVLNPGLGVPEARVRELIAEAHVRHRAGLVAAIATKAGEVRPDAGA